MHSLYEKEPVPSIKFKWNHFITHHQLIIILPYVHLLPIWTMMPLNILFSPTFPIALGFLVDRRNMSSSLYLGSLPAFSSDICSEIYFLLRKKKLWSPWCPTLTWIDCFPVLLYNWYSGHCFHHRVVPYFSCRWCLMGI